MKYILLVVLFLSFSAHSLTLDDARKQGLAIELETGFLEAKSPKAKLLVADINKKRKAAYIKVQNDTGAPFEAVAKQAAKKIKAKLAK